jgi:hypothetical protein
MDLEAERLAVIENIRAWRAGTEMLDVRALTDHCHRRFPDASGPMSWAALLMLAEFECEECP